MKGHFELEVFSSESVLLTQLPESSSRMIAGEWTEATAGVALFIWGALGFWGGGVIGTTRRMKR